ncbi:pilus assembly protein PilP [Nitrospira sp. Nam80]
MGGQRLSGDRSRGRGHGVMPIAGGIGLIVCLLPLMAAGQVNTIRPSDSLKMPSVQELPRQEQNANMPGLLPAGNLSRSEPAVASIGGEAAYDPSGRRDPFAPIVENNNQGQSDAVLPPLQRIGLTELSLIGVVWGAYGYTAMVQTPDGKGYSIRRGTRVGPNNGVVSSITERGIIVQERFTDVYGNKQEREYVKLLHAKEGIE